MINYIILFGIVISLINSLARADYSLPIFIFSYIMWEYEKVQQLYYGQFRLRIIYMIFFSFFVDGIYLIIWVTIYSHIEYVKDGLDQFFKLDVTYTTIALMITKFIIVIGATVKEESVKKSMTPVAVKDSIMTFISLQNNKDD
ncbi:hypothetical protein pb186bvf_001248 [Paramecium bursaria]